jgi:mono/diheme cytochrome c family protein
MTRQRSDPESAAAVFLLVALAFVAAALLGGFFLGRATKGSTTVAAASSTTSSPSSTTSSPASAVDPRIAAGAHDFVGFACAQCHGLDGRGGVSPFVPALKNLSSVTAAELSHIINHGLGESAKPSHPYMPVWGQVISARQVDDLVAYIHAGLPKVSTATPVAVPKGQGLAVEGQALYTLYGCVNCHGPNGLGGVPNPLSPDKTIPPLSGAAFFKQFNTDQSIKNVIVSGSVIGRAPIVSMPHWGGIIPPDRLNALVAYIKTLKTG